MPTGHFVLEREQTEDCVVGLVIKDEHMEKGGTAWGVSSQNLEVEIM